jgi:hypothetical protein
MGEKWKAATLVERCLLLPFEVRLSRTKEDARLTAAVVATD